MTILKSGLTDAQSFQLNSRLCLAEGAPTLDWSPIKIKSTVIETPVLSLIF